MKFVNHNKLLGNSNAESAEISAEKNVGASWLRECVSGDKAFG